jgi:hypothetical protein
MFVQIGDMAFNPDQVCKIEWSTGPCVTILLTGQTDYPVVLSGAEADAFTDWWEEYAKVYRTNYPDYFAEKESNDAYNQGGRCERRR